MTRPAPNIDVPAILAILLLALIATPVCAQPQPPAGRLPAPGAPPLASVIVDCAITATGLTTGCQVAIHHDEHTELEGRVLDDLIRKPRPVPGVLAGDHVRLLMRRPVRTAAGAAGAPDVLFPPLWRMDRAHPAQLNFPDRALRMNVTGNAVLHCMVASGGALTGCSVVSENPDGFGFGNAALKTAASLRVDPVTEVGDPIEGIHLLFAIQFAISGTPGPPVRQDYDGSH